MLSRNDTITLGQQVDVGKALDLLTMFKEAGKERIDVRTILDEAAPKIKDYAALLEYGLPENGNTVPNSAKSSPNPASAPAPLTIRPWPNFGPEA